MDYFQRIITHYTTILMDKAGYHSDWSARADTQAELQSAFDDLRKDLAQRDERIAELEQRFSKLSAQFDGLICELEHQGDPEGF